MDDTDFGSLLSVPAPLKGSSACYDGVEGLRAYRGAGAEMCAISGLDDPRSFRAQCRIYHLGAAVLVDVRSSALRYLRTARHVALGAYDHYQIVFNLSGAIHYQSTRHSIIVRPGDIVIVDSAREVDARVQAPGRALAHARALFVPRAALASLRREPAGGHLLRLSGELPVVRSLHGRLSQIPETIEIDAPDQVCAAAQGLIAMLASSLGHRRPRLAPGRHTHRSAADFLERLIERRLDSPALSIELLCSHSGCSRATVYRLLETEGGPIRYIRQRRLQRAFRELISGKTSDRPIRELALRHRFASEATFNRAFRRTFGLPPGEVREIAARARRPALARGAGLDALGKNGADAIGWIRNLSGAG